MYGFSSLRVSGLKQIMGYNEITRAAARPVVFNYVLRKINWRKRRRKPARSLLMRGSVISPARLVS